MIDNRYAAVSWLLSAVVLFEHSVTLFIYAAAPSGCGFFCFATVKMTAYAYSKAWIVCLKQLGNTLGLRDNK